jgi:hypothetical protein
MAGQGDAAVARGLFDASFGGGGVYVKQQGGSCRFSDEDWHMIREQATAPAASKIVQS